jgi:hypothetical protein
MIEQFEVDGDLRSGKTNKKKSKFSSEDFVKNSIKKKAADFQSDDLYKKAMEDVRESLFKDSIEEVDNSDSMHVYLRKLKEAELIDEYDFGKEYDSLDFKKVMELSSQSFEVGLDDESGNIYYLDGKNHKIFLDFDFEDDVFHRKNVSALLPDISFDILQNGDIEKAKESEAIYKTIVINEIFNGLYTDLIKESLSGYNFDDLCPDDDKRNFRDILKIMLEESSAVLRIIIGACNLKLVEFKTKKDLKLLRSISDQEDQELRDLRIKLAIHRNEWARKIALKETKAQREVEREKMRKEEADIIDDSGVSLIYQILSLSTDSIPMKPRIEIARLAKILAFNVKDKVGYKGGDAMVLKLANRFQRRGYREYLSDMKSRYLSSLRKGEDFDLRPKA